MLYLNRKAARSRCAFLIRFRCQSSRIFFFAYVVHGCLLILALQFKKVALERGFSFVYSWGNVSISPDPFEADLS